MPSLMVKIMSLKSISDYINKIVEYLSALALLTSLSLVIVQVFFRYILNQPLGFTQEAAIYGMIASVLLGSSIAFKKNAHLHIDLLFRKAGNRLSALIDLIANTVVILFLIILCYQGFLMSERAMLQTSPQTGIPVGYFVAFIPISSAICIIHLSFSLNDIRKRLLK